jgi:ABC-type multidrug transport system ATPase subunit
MDEADLLGDRIAIMNKGKLRVLGSSLFLKSRFGIGYTLTISTTKAASSSSSESNSGTADSLLDFIRVHVQTAELVSQAGTEISFTLPLSASKSFAELFGQLESRKQELAVQDFGVSVTSLEEVFLRLAGEGEEEADDHNQMHERKVSTPGEKMAILGQHSSERNSKLGFDDGTGHGSADDAWSLVEPSQLKPTMGRQVRALLSKRMLYAKRSRKYFMMQVFMPIVYVVAGILIAKLTKASEYSTDMIELDPSLFNGQMDKAGQKSEYLTLLSDGAAALAAGTNTALQASSGGINGFTVEPSCCIDPGRFSSLVSTCTSDAVKYSQGTLDATTAASWCTFNAKVLSDAQQLGKAKYAVGVLDMNTNSGAQPAAPGPAPAAAGTYAGYRLMVNSTVLNSIPVLSSLVHSALAHAAKISGLPPAGPSLFKPAYQPWPRVPGEKNAAALVAGLVGGLQMGIWTTIAISYMPGLIVFFVTMEKEKKIAHQQRVMGVSATAYHLSNYIFDCAAFVPALVILTALFAFLAVDAIKNNVGGVFVMLLCYLPAAAPYAYIVSRNFTKAMEAQGTALGLSVLFSMITTIAYFFMLILYSVNTGAEADKWQNISRIVGNVGCLLFPPFCVGSGLINLSFYFNKDIGFMSAMPSIFDWNKGIGRSVVFLVVDTVVYWTILLALERRDERVANTGYDGGLASHADDVNRPTDSPPDGEDADVQAERRRMAAQPGDNISVLGLRKVYPPRKIADEDDDDDGMSKEPEEAQTGPRIKRNAKAFCSYFKSENKERGAHEAVKDMYIGIKRGECFGLLGVNGAGKTTTLSMLTGDVRPTSGTASLAGYDVSTELPKVLGQVGYCPQFDALLEELTGFELLRIFAALKGVPENSLEAVVQSLIRKVGLTPHAQNPTKGYSGGNKRKLSLAMALVGSPTLVFLDEPSSGMDPFARREMWKVIQTTAAKLGSSVILTTHFMEEADALCGRIGIMVDGRLACIGSSQHLKSTYGAGYQVELRLGNVDSQSQSKLREFVGSLCPASAVQVAEIDDSFDYIGAVKILEHHAGQLRCELPSSGLSLASVFSKIEDAKCDLGIEDYAVSQTSLEQVFLKFAKGRASQ